MNIFDFMDHQIKAKRKERMSFEKEGKNTSKCRNPTRNNTQVFSASNDFPVNSTALEMISCCTIFNLDRRQNLRETERPMIFDPFEICTDKRSPFAKV